MCRKERVVVSTRVVYVRRGNGCVALFPIGEISFLSIKYLFTGIEAVASSVVGKDKNIGSVHNLNVIMPSQQIVKEVVVLLQLPESIGKIKMQYGFWIGHAQDNMLVIIYL